MLLAVRIDVLLDVDSEQGGVWIGSYYSLSHTA